MILLYPSEVMIKYGLYNHQISNHDLIEEVINCLNNEGIKIFLYTHPRDGHDMLPEDAAKVGWITCPESVNPIFEKFNYGIECGGFTCTGSTCQNQNTIFKRFKNCLFL